MSLTSQRWRSVGEPASDSEREALEQVRALLPDDPLCFAWSNLSIPDHVGLPTEIDLLLLNGAGLFVVELKGWHGEIAGKSYDWSVKGTGAPRRRRSPVPATQNKARQVKSLLVELRDEQHGRTPLPYVAPVVVLHGKRSTAKLDDRARHGVYGLDGYDVKGVPSFSTFLREPPVRGDRLDKTAVDAIARLLKVAGMEPLPRDEPDQTPAEVTPPAAAPHTEEDEQVPLLSEVSDDELVQLGVPADRLDRVRPIRDELEWIGLVPDHVFDDLLAVLDGTSVEDVLARRRESEAIFAAVAEQAVAATEPELAGEAAGVPTGETEHAPPPEDRQTSVPPVIPPEVPAARPASLPDDDIERLRAAFGDRVVVRAPRTDRPPPAAKPSRAARSAPPVSPRRPFPSPDAVVDETAGVASERLLDVARVEALLGRSVAARRLLREVEAHLDINGVHDWSRAELQALAGRLSEHSLLAQRLEVLADGVGAGGLPAPDITPAAVVEVGSLWAGEGVGPAYSLLLRVPDVLDRASGVYLSQHVGEARAAAVNARLRVGRPDGGRVRITPDGTVVSRRDGSSPWFVVGAVRAEEWFPAAGSTPDVFASAGQRSA